MLNTRTVIIPYKFASKSAKALAAALGIRRHSIKQDTSASQIINWGCSFISEARMPLVEAIANQPLAVRIAADKRRFFATMPKEVLPVHHIAGVLTDRVSAEDRIREDLANKPKAVWFARDTLNGHSGEGITIITSNNVDEYFSRHVHEQALLYTRKFYQTAEFRVHFCGRRIFDVQQKKRRLDMPDDQVNWLIRNHKNGFIYARAEVELPPAIGDWITNYIRRDSFELDFGAFDVLYSEKTETWCILEINTAPGLTGTTLENYANAFRAFI